MAVYCSKATNPTTANKPAPIWTRAVPSAAFNRLLLLLLLLPVALGMLVLVTRLPKGALVFDPDPEPDLLVFELPLVLLPVLPPLLLPPPVLLPELPLLLLPPPKQESQIDNKECRSAETRKERL